MIAVTGYTGFVGKEFLKNHDSDEYLLLGRNKLESHSNFRKFNLETANKDLESFSLSGVDVLVHIAARVHVMNETTVNPLAEYRRINVGATISLAKAAAAAGVSRFIFISSIKVNGEETSQENPFSAISIPSPTEPYGISKLEAEQCLKQIGSETGMEIVIIRPPLVYGQGVKANFAALMNLVNKRIPLPFRAISQNKRSLVSVYNLVDLIEVCLTHPKAANETFLVSDDHDLSTSEVIKLMANANGKTNLSLPVPVFLFNLLGKLSGKQHVVDRLTGSLALDITHTKKTLGWKPPFSVEYGFSKSINK